jgi:integrase
MLPPGFFSPQRVRPEIATLADLDEAIADDLTLTEEQRISWRGYLRRIGGWLERPLHALPASLPGLRYGFQRLQPAALGVTEKTIQNHRSELKRILVQAGVLDSRPQGTPLSAAWQPLLELLGGQPNLQRGLCQAIRFWSARGIVPDQVNDAAVAAYVEHLRTSTFRQRPEQLHRQVCKLWNDAAGQVKGWPAVKLTVPDFRKPADSLPWDAFPPSFCKDVEAYLFWLSDDNQMADDAPVKSCNARTQTKMRKHIQLAASAAVAGGVPAESLASLGDLVRPATARVSLDHYLAREGKVTVFIVDMAQLLASIGRRWARLPASEQAMLGRLFEKLVKKKPRGMTPKNLKAIREITDPINYPRLVGLSEVLLEEARKQKHTSVRATTPVGVAVALQILLVAPMRIGNLAGLDLKRHLIRVGGPRGTWHLHIASCEVKNQVPLDYPLPPSTSRLIDAYLTEFRPRLPGAGTNWLFPGEGDEPKGESTLSGQITNQVLKRIGIRVTAHQFRHAAAAVLLTANPGNYELVRRVLGHKNLTTTTSHYVGLESAAAVKVLQGLVLGAGPEANG